MVILREIPLAPSWRGACWRQDEGCSDTVSQVESDSICDQGGQFRQDSCPSSTALRSLTSWQTHLLPPLIVDNLRYLAQLSTRGILISSSLVNQELITVCSETGPPATLLKSTTCSGWHSMPFHTQVPPLPTLKCPQGLTASALPGRGL